ncbi:MAG: DUF2218 domain-containing protein [Pseudorhizobium sp.]
MDTLQTYRLSGIALPMDALSMLDEICEHFVEHSDVQRTDDSVLLKSEVGTADIKVTDQRLLIELACPTEEALHLTRNMIAEHLFYFANEEPFELSWIDAAEVSRLPNLHEATVVSAEDVTPRMRRVKVACQDVTPFIDGDVHVRVLVPPRGRSPVWPGLGHDGRIAWPKGEDEITARVYTIRAVDAERRELWMDFLQHPAPAVTTPGADFARDAQPGDRIALIGPGGSLPQADNLLLAGDETALPAIARIAAEAPAGCCIKAIIEVEDEDEEQSLPSKASIEVHWLHRKTYFVEELNRFQRTVKSAIAASSPGTYTWVACEKTDARVIRSFLKERGQDRKSQCVAWYWERGKASH